MPANLTERQVIALERIAERIADVLEYFRERDATASEPASATASDATASEPASVAAVESESAEQGE